MPPKAAPNKKTEQKKKEKIIEDKTFGLKNKKGTKQQKFIQQVEKNVQNKFQNLQKADQQKQDAKSKKQLEQEKLDELSQLFKPVAEMPKVSKDVDPKSILCAFFKQGLCQKGDRCKWSHDLAVERKTEKKSAYFDSREADTMDNWDDAKLSEVVEQKHGEKEKLKPKTDIICKYFLDALENSKYGWFWECPNGDTCIYRHALPPGYVLKKDKKKLDEESKEDQISLEELIEKERAALGSNLTKVTLETFLAWKTRKVKEKKAKAKAAEAKKRNEFKAGRQAGLSGRDLFTFNPDLVLQDDEEADDTVYRMERLEEEGAEAEACDIDMSLFVHIDDIDDELDGIDDDVVGNESKSYKEADEAISNGPSSSKQNTGYRIDEALFNADEIPDSDDGSSSASDNDDFGEDDADEFGTEPVEPRTSAVTTKLKSVNLNK